MYSCVYVCLCVHLSAKWCSFVRGMSGVVGLLACSVTHLVVEKNQNTQSFETVLFRDNFLVIVVALHLFCVEDVCGDCVQSLLLLLKVIKVLCCFFPAASAAAPMTEGLNSKIVCAGKYFFKYNSITSDQTQSSFICQTLKDNSFNELRTLLFLKQHLK